MIVSRNAESRFSLAPSANIGRSRFDRPSSIKLSFNTGDLVPFYVDEVLPGDTFNVKTSKVVRMQTLITPLMDNLYLDTYYFFVPNRIVWTHWKEFMGENTAGPWAQTVNYTTPKIVSPSGGFATGTIADYMGVPTGVAGLECVAFPFRAYALICNEFFRDQNLSDPLQIEYGDSNVTGVNTGTYITDVAKGGLPFKAAKFHDYFTSCLPGPQKGSDVGLNLSGDLPVNTGDPHSVDPINLSWKIFNANGVDTTKTYQPVTGSYLLPAVNSPMFDGVNEYVKSTARRDAAGATVGDATYFVPANLWADMSSATMISVNALRTAFQLQRFLERDARSGTRYVETIKAHFNVTSPDSRLQRPEYLGGNRLPININQVVQQSGTESGSTAQGHTAAYSLTVDSHSDFTRSFTEHGFVIGVMVARYDHSYQQGLERFWSRNDKYDYFWPVFANLSEQPVLNKEIYAQGPSVLDPVTNEKVDDQVFGYQEAYADYRYKPNRVAGEMRSTATTPLDSWHLADKYNSLPQLSDSWIREDKTMVDRTLAVQSSVSNQLFADIYIKNTSVRPMPVYSVPGLIDHF